MAFILYIINMAYSKVLLLIFCVYLTSGTLLNDVAQKCLLVLNQSDVQINTRMEFWQVWIHMEVPSLIIGSSEINSTVRAYASTRPTEWADFDPEKDQTPAHFKDPRPSSNHNFWDPANDQIIWEYRLWLGCSYLELYKQSKIEKYLTVAVRLYELIVTRNADPTAAAYKGIFWSPKTQYYNSISNQLFMAFAGKLFDVTGNPRHLQAAERQQWLLFQQSAKYINNNTMDIFPDGVGAYGFYSYNQIMALGGLAYLVKHGSDPEFSLSQISRLINGVIQFFHSRFQSKLIMTDPESGNKYPMSMFRGTLFRELIHVKEVLTDSQWGQVVSKSPRLRLFIVDNTQAISRFESIPPNDDWTRYNDTPTKYYTIFPQFYVIRAGEKLFNITEKVVEGVEFPCNAVWQIEATPNVTSIRLATLEVGQNNSYREAKSYKLERGGNYFKYFLNEDWCDSKNNINVATLQWEYSNG